MPKFNPQARHRARYFALQALYEWQISGNTLSDIEAQFMLQNEMAKVDVAYFQELLHGVPKSLDELDTLLTPLLDRPLKELDPVELAIMRIGLYELAKRIDVPYRVVINESLELAKTFGAEDGYKYVNGVLDKAAQQLRAAEIQRR